MSEGVLQSTTIKKNGVIYSIDYIKSTGAKRPKPITPKRPIKSKRVT